MLPRHDALPLRGPTTAAVPAPPVPPSLPRAAAFYVSGRSSIPAAAGCCVCFGFELPLALALPEAGLDQRAPVATEPRRVHAVERVDSLANLVSGIVVG